MISLAPSMMCADILELRSELDALAEAGADLLHIDIMDGNYVPNFALNTDIMRAISESCAVPMDAHLMVREPERYIELFAEAGAEIITPHIEMLEHPVRTLRRIRALGKKAGIAISPATDPSFLRFMLEYVDLVCVMTVDPGFAGQKLVPSAYQKLREVAELVSRAGHEVRIMADGQVNLETAPKMMAAGADVLVLGSSGLFRCRRSEYASVLSSFRALETKSGSLPA